MYLRELRVNGFKSFADPTKLTFDTGVTAIVGPNGCGKSNIADAIRWVLGEQSAKALRGGKMQDVIFEGTDQRKPVQLCEVSLVFTECEPLLGDGFHEVEITRRVSRDGQSDYFLNGKACRLKDIQRIFMDTGIGRSSYSIMAQGQIDQILSSNPVERRAIFEEAAGITKYKSQRREALNKLKLVEGNLARLTDVLDEVRRQINTLRRQASKALRYKKIRHRLEKLDLAYNGHQYSILEEELGGLEEKLTALQTDVARETADLESRESAIEERKAERSALNSRLQEAQQAVFDLRSRKEQAENAARLAEARGEDYSGRLADATKEIERMEKELSATSEEVVGSAQTKKEQHEVVANSDRFFQTRDQEVRALQARLAEEEKALGAEKQNLLKAENEAVRLRSRNTEFDLSLKSDEVRAAGLDEEIASLEKEKVAADESLARFADAMKAAEEDQAAAQQALEEARARVVGGRDAYRAKQAEIQVSDRAVAQNNARLRVLQQLQEKLEGFSEGAKALLQGKLDEVLPEGTEYFPLTRNIQAKPDCAPALETLLGSAIDSVAVKDPEVALRVLHVLDERKMGKACLSFFPEGNGRSDRSSDLPPTIKPAAELFTVEGDGDDAGHPLGDLLARSYFAADAAAFFEFWKTRPDFDFQHVVTAKGELIDRRGLVFGGYHKGKGNSILQRESEIRDLKKEIAAEQKRLTALKEEAEALQTSLEEAEKGVETAHVNVRDASGKRTSLETELRSAEKAREETLSRSARLVSDREKLQARRAAAHEESDTLRRKLAEAEKALDDHKAAIATCEERIRSTRTELEQEREKLSEARFDLAQKKQRLEMLDRGLSEMETKTAELQRGIEHRRQEIERLGEQIESLRKENIQQKENAAAAETELKSAQENVEKVRRQYSSVEEEITAAEKAVHDRRTELDKRRSELNALQVRQAERKSRRDYLLEEIEREYELSLPEVDWRECLWRAEDEPAGPHPLDLDDDEDTPKRKRKTAGPRPDMTDEDRAAMDDTDWSAVKAEIDTLRSRIHSMGPVNLVAIEEYVELKERHEFLNTQHSDLVESRDELLRAIDDINERSTAQFKEIFEQITKNFTYTFQSLFGGGKANLELLESEDPLEAGIDIIAQPPGTKLKGIVLLSGGQKTMTAVALLFAIYMVKPSPFCVLDELDAPLDEANIGRFTGMLREFTQESQFLIITHNKRTISEAQAIFGVTMEEKGVSKVVSMRFNSERQRTEPEHTGVPELAGERG